MLDASAHSLEHVLVRFSWLYLSRSPASCNIPHTTSRRSRLHCNDVGTKAHGCLVEEIIGRQASFLGLGLFLLEGVVQKLGVVGLYRREGGKVARLCGWSIAMQRYISGRKHMWTQNMVMNNISGMLDIKSRYRIKDMDAVREVPGEVALRRELQMVQAEV